MSIIVVSIPADLDIKEIDLKENEWIEYRLDIQEKVGRTEHIPLNDKSILTWRMDSSDTIAYQEKIRLFHERVKQSNCMVDVELENYEDFED
ncbi:MAG TPA: hypothetical protein PKJ08_09555, partial [Candidatus Cloacimonadota bacterium]|nr:hypothetical protein [Candidatus Cloacimonadota bacterium]